jgi:hypothetical protein
MWHIHLRNTLRVYNLQEIFFLDGKNQMKDDACVFINQAERVHLLRVGWRNAGEDIICTYGMVCRWQNAPDIQELQSI